MNFKEWIPPWRNGGDDKDKGIKNRSDFKPENPPEGEELFNARRDKPRGDFQKEQESILNIKKRLLEEKKKIEQENPEEDFPEEIDPEGNPKEDDQRIIPGEQSKEPNSNPPHNPNENK